jgi:hypothetical protein
VAVLSAATLWSASASANPVLRFINSGAATVDVIDNGIGDIDGTSGNIATLYAGGVFGVDLQFGSSNTLAGPPPSIVQKLFYTVTSTGAGTLTMQISEKDLTLADLNNAFLSFGGTTSIGEVSVAAYVDAGNTLFATTTSLLSAGPVGGPAFNGDLQTVLTGTANPFSLTLEVTFEHFGAAVTTGDAELTLLPEPMSTALLGLGLLGAGLMRRRARR